MQHLTNLQMAILSASLPSPIKVLALTRVANMYKESEIIEAQLNVGADLSCEQEYEKRLPDIG